MFRATHNGRRKTAGGPPAVKGYVDYDLGAARRAAYVAKLGDGGGGAFSKVGER